MARRARLRPLSRGDFGPRAASRDTLTYGGAVQPARPRWLPSPEVGRLLQPDDSALRRRLRCVYRPDPGRHLFPANPRRARGKNALVANAILAQRRRATDRCRTRSRALRPAAP